MSRSTLFVIASISLAACGDDGMMTSPDANNALADIGFDTPTKTLKANREISEDNWEEIGPADLSCLNTASADQASTTDVMLNVKVTDFQSGNAVPGATVIAFPNQDEASKFDQDTSSSTADLQLTVPMGTKRFGFKITSGTSLPTFLLNQTLDSPTATEQPEGTCTPSPCRKKVQSVSNATAATLPALIGQTRTAGTGVVAGALRDCQGREVSGFVATISSTSATATTLEGAEAYYFSSSVGLPVHHSQASASTEDGLFMIIQVPTSTPTGFVQMWGFPADTDLAAGRAGLKLIAELQVPIFSDTVITGSYEPLRN